jgi:hypothetical protein
MSDQPGVGKLYKLFRSNNYFFMIFKDPVMQVRQTVDPDKSEDYSVVHELHNKMVEQIPYTLPGSDSSVNVTPLSLNLFEFLIARNRPLTLLEIRIIIYDLLMTL